MSLGPRSPPTGAPSAAPAARLRTRAASTWASKRAARCEFGRTSQGTGAVPASCSGRSVLGTARRAWVPDCQTPGWRQVRSRASRAPQGTPHSGQGTAWPRLLATPARGSSGPPPTSPDQVPKTSQASPSPTGRPRSAASILASRRIRNPHGPSQHDHRMVAQGAARGSRDRPS